MPSPPITAIPGRVLLPGVLVFSALAWACGGSGSPPPTPVSPAVSPVPSSVPVDLAEADRLYYEGSFEEAVGIYSAAVLRGTPDQRQEALWRLARVQYKRGDNEAVERNVKTLLEDGPTPNPPAGALLLLGTAELAQGKTKEAREHLEQYIQAGGAAAAYAHLRLADLASREGDAGEAVRELDLALAADLPAATATQASFALASYQEQDGDTAAAMDTYDSLSARGATGSDAAEALWRLAALARTAADDDRRLGALVRLVQQYPWHERALEALGLPDAAFAFTSRERALVLFRQHQDAEAAESFRAVLEQSPDEAGEAHYYLALLAERGGDYAGALPEYDAAVAALEPAGDAPFLGQVLWDRGLLLESLGRREEAAAAYGEIADRAPSSEYAAKGLFKAGLQRYGQGLYYDASAFWARYLTAAPDAEDVARANFWLARAATQLGDPGGAADHLRQAAAANPLDYYGLRAAAVLAAQPTPAGADGVTPATPDWVAAERWLQAWAGREDAAARTILFAGGYWTRGVELLHAGLEKEAGAEFEELLARAEGEPWQLYRLSRAFDEEGRASLSARAGGLLLLLAPETPPPAMVALACPLAYFDLAKKSAVENGFSPLLLLALVRQESLYDPDALSPAEALGLTQVIPSTAEEIARELGEPDFRQSDLLRPKVSLRFGAHYLGAQLAGFGGLLPAALAAYNGGAGNAGRWQEAAGADPDVFLESIDFAETRSYVERVLENYARYLYAYGASATPTLPL